MSSSATPAPSTPPKAKPPTPRTSSSANTPRAASAYVGMTRGRDTNTVHIVAESIDQARQIWVETFSRDQADLGPAVAARRAQADADRYAPQRPLAEALADLRAAWTVEADTRAQLTRTRSDLDQLREFMAVKAERETTLAPLVAARDHADQAAAHATKQAERLDQLLDAVTTQYANQLTQHWDATTTRRSRRSPRSLSRPRPIRPASPRCPRRSRRARTVGRQLARHRYAPAHRRRPARLRRIRRRHPPDSRRDSRLRPRRHRTRPPGTPHRARDSQSHHRAGPPIRGDLPAGRRALRPRVGPLRQSRLHPPP